jgi:guanylate kinase
MPRKRKTNEDVINKLKELLDNYHEIIELQDKLNQEKFIVNKQFEDCIIDIKNILSKL